MRQLAYVFQDLSLLEAALTHRSISGKNNERLEFLGDSILNFVISAELFSRYPKATEGELSRLRASLVKGETLTILARKFALGDYLKLGPGELKSGGFNRNSILADAMEAIIGAIYLDAGLSIVRECILNWYAEQFVDLSALKVVKDAKTQLQEYLQSHKYTLPEYTVLAIEGKTHAQKFYVQCQVEGFTQIAQGVADSRRKAEQKAAEKFLELLKENESEH
jgi:ribonuclease-3